MGALDDGCTKRVGSVLFNRQGDCTEEEQRVEGEVRSVGSGFGGFMKEGKVFATGGCVIGSKGCL